MNCRFKNDNNLIKIMIKKIYVYLNRFIYTIFICLGVIYILKKFKSNQYISWFLSLFYIWDIEGLIYLDCPWWTYKSIKKIDLFLQNKKNVIAFEYGSGASTIWLAKRVKILYSVEHNPDWYKVVSDYVQKFLNVNYLYKKIDLVTHSSKYSSTKEKGVTFHQYVTSINSINKMFDLIVIDGRARNACLEQALKKIKKGGIIIFDNCNRKRYKNELIKLKNKIEYYPGLTPSLPYSECTAIIYNK